LIAVHIALIAVHIVLIVVHIALIVVHIALIVVHIALIAVNIALIAVHIALIVVHIALIVVHIALIAVIYVLCVHKITNFIDVFIIYTKKLRASKIYIKLQIEKRYYKQKREPILPFLYSIIEKDYSISTSTSPSSMLSPGFTFIALTFPSRSDVKSNYEFEIRPK